MTIATPEPATPEPPVPSRWIDRRSRPPLSAPLERAIVFFETISPDAVAEIPALYAPDARFRDPFNELQGRQAIAAVFAHMFEALDAPRFMVLEAFGDSAQGFVTWDFDFGTHGARGRRRRIHGSTHFRFDAQGRIALHRDYWDAAGELYETLPLLGGVLRWLRRRLATPPTFIASHAGHGSPLE